MGKNKYGAKRTNGFSSKLEQSVYNMLLNREEAGKISDIKCQQKVYLTDARILYIADFSFQDIDSGALVFCEAKGVETATWRLKRKLWEFYGPGRLEIWMGSHARPFLKETISPR